MKNKVISYICKPHCAFYREGKEVLVCGAVEFVMENFNYSEIEAVPEDYSPDHSLDRWILKRVCRRCNFYPQDCGYRCGEGTPSCGGYTVLEFLRKKHP